MQICRYKRIYFVNLSFFFLRYENVLTVVLMVYKKMVDALFKYKLEKWRKRLKNISNKILIKC